jgi:ABC-type multidrug transport system ATPase subunit
MLGIDSVSLSFGGREILSGCYLNGSKGEIVGLLGRNGSGKSSLLRIIFGTLRADFKHLRIEDKIVNKAYSTRQVAYLSQESFLPPFLKVGSLIKQISGDSEHSEPWEMLVKQSNKRVGELSGGELRILEFLWILQQSADYILLDEPFSGVAPILVELLQEKIRKASSNKCIILTDHIYRALLPISDRLLLLHNNSVYPIKDEEELAFYGYIPS